MTERTAPRTFDLDKTLPPLPVPTLEATAARYLATVEPLVDAPAFERTKTAVAELLAEGGVGRKLQAALVERASKMDNWLAGWWEDYAYLTYQEPLIINSSIGISTDARNTHPSQAIRAAELTAGTIDFYLGIVNETLPPEVQKDGSGFDMSLLKRFFATNRFPGLEKDRIATYDFDDSRHVLVLRRGQYFVFDVLSEDRTRLSAGEIATQFQRIIATADAADPIAPVGLLTADNRAVWARNRDILALDPTNRGNLDRIDRALFLVYLDHESHEGFETLARAGLYGPRGSRWYDKNFGLVVDAAGRFTLHGEHSPVDAGAWVPLIEAITPAGAPFEPAGGDVLPQPLHLRWNLSADTLGAIANAADVYDRLTGDLDLRIAHFTDFGKELIKTFKTGPDPFVQTAFMLAYCRTYGRLPKTYEAASTRMFRGGRTETIRTASPQALSFVQAMDDASVGLADKQARLRAAFVEHGQRGKDASAGQAVDRHLLGLRLIAPEVGVTELPALFHEEIYKRGWELSTAQLPMKHGFVNHFGAVCPEGYGIGYIIKDDHININMTSFRSHPMTDTARYLEAVTQAMRDMRTLLEAVPAAAGVAPSGPA
jgi:carnitine O-acetyltransferase